ncbi:MAG: hypothetical protein F6K28_58215, partial [Microcoleus sp. SIO2G3]|nr:hypothetical protein [Microcoleus sp. SIO2G3]
MFGKSQKFAQLRNSDLSVRTNRARLLGDGDDSIDNARDLGKLSKSSKIDRNGSVTDDDPDFFKFKIKGGGSLKMNFKNEGEESINFSIVNKQGRVISADGRRLFVNVDDGDKGKFDVRLGKGTFFIKVDSGSRDDENYSFKLKFKSN